MAQPAQVADAAPCIGGFFETHVPDENAGGESLLDAWTEGRPFTAFVNARSAFAALAVAFPEATIWAPAYLCANLIDGSLTPRTRFYPVGDDFQPALEVAGAAAGPADILLIVAFFGRPLSDASAEIIARRPDLRVVEDRAQALDAGPGLGHGWRLFSPRKLFGVADGGLLVAMDAEAVLPQATAQPDVAALWRACRLRAEDPQGQRNQAWHAANQAKEAAMEVTDQAMTAASLSLLSRTSLRSLAASRLRNWRRLDGRLRPWSALPADPGFPPLGYVLELEPDRRDALARALHAERIFAAVHWPELASPAAEFPDEHHRSRRLITLPCDHRYGESDMDRIASRVLDQLR